MEKPAPDCEAAGARRHERDWMGWNEPSLCPGDMDALEFDIPGYDLRKLMLARNPLAAANAFSVYVRVVLAKLLGIRMCHNCPHCSMSSSPCSDAFGSNAEPMGGIAGRCDALFGAVEAQRSTGSLHLHFFHYGQRLHQFHTLEEIAVRLRAKLVNADDFKR